MSKNMTRKGLAFGAGFALVATGLAAMPAHAAAGDFVNLVPSVGTNTGVFVNDDFQMKTAISAQVSATTAAFKIDDAGSNTWLITVEYDSDGNGTFDSFADQVSVASIDAQGTYGVLNAGVDLDTDSAGDGADDEGTFAVSMDDADAVSLIIYGIQDDGPLVASDRLIQLTMTPISAAADDSAGAAFDFTAGDHIFEIGTVADTVTKLAYGAGDVEASVTAWVESEAVADYETVDATYSSNTAAATWYDPKGVVAIPRVERFNTNLNDVGNNLHATLEFNKSINYEMFDRTEWTYDITTTELPTFANDTDLVEEENIAGLGSATKNADVFGRYAFDTAQAIAANTTYTVNVHSELAEEATGVERWFSSTGYSVGTGTATGTMVVEPQITDTDDVDFTGITPATGTDEDNAADVNFATASIRAGVNAVTYSTQLQSGDPLADNESVSVPMLAVVTNGSFMPAGSSISVAGNASPITKASEVRTVTGFTDAKGKFSVTVNSVAANKDESYTVAFYVLRNGVYVNQYTPDVENAGGVPAADTNGQLSTIAASYSAADAGNTSLTAVNSVVAGETVTVSFTVEDQFGEAISETAKGKQLNLGLAASVTDNLNEAAVVPADGEVSFTFDNYLTVGSSDLLTATLYTGTASDPTTVDTATVTLYNTGATGAVQVPATLVGDITYDDYIPNGEKVTAGVNVNPSNDIELTGTVVDANGVGIPAAVVTISAPGMQIQEEGSSRYYQDEHTINANAAGVFDVNLNAHTVNTTGVDVTVTTADGKTATTVVKTFLPKDSDSQTAGDQDLNGDNLVFTVDLPEVIVMNQTYAVTAKLTDKWGNPVKTGTNAAVHFQGTGSVEINGLTTEVEKSFDANGEALVYVRSVKDIAGPGTIAATLQDDPTYTNQTAGVAGTQDLDAETNTTTDSVLTAWDETLFESTFSQVVEVFETAADAPASADAKVNAGSFKGYVAVYAKGYEGQRLSAKIGNDWVIVDPIVNNEGANLHRTTDFTGAGVDIAVRIYIDRVLIDTINLTTK